VIGVAANPWATDLDHELKRLYWKPSGAEFVITQPVFDVKGLETFVRRAAEFKLRSSRDSGPDLAAERRVPGERGAGIYVPESVLEKMRRRNLRRCRREQGPTKDHDRARDAGRREGPGAGVQVSAPFGTSSRRWGVSQ